jgi:hypothetical protein
MGLAMLSHSGSEKQLPCHEQMPAITLCDPRKVVVELRDYLHRMV